MPASRTILNSRRSVISPRVRAAILLGVAFCVPGMMSAQEGGGADVDYEPPPDGEPTGIVTLSAGYVLSSPRNDFPSLIIGPSFGGTGTVPADYATAGSGYTVDLEGLFYFNQNVGLAFAFASMRYSAEYRGDGTVALLPTRMEVQEGEFRVGVHLAVPGGVEPGSAGLRSVFAEGAFEVGLGIIGNRVYGGAVLDSTSEQRTERSGSFEGGDPFRHRIGLRLGGGFIVDLTNDASGNGLSLKVGTAYSIGLNPVFSSDVVEENSFTIDHLILSGGLGYRF